MKSEPRSLRREVWWILAYIPLTIGFTWPLTARFTTELAGVPGDTWQNLWNFDWIRRSLAAGHSPYFTHDLWYPEGVTLVFQTFDLPDALWAAPLLRHLGLWPTYNLVVLAAFVLSAGTMYALGRSLGASRPASFFSGCAYTFSTYHFAHARGHLHIVAMQWVPLFALAWWRVLEDERWRWGVLAGLFLLLASLASWYYALGCSLIAAGTGVAWLIRTRGRSLRTALPSMVLLWVTYLICIGPLGWAMVRARNAEPVGGSHDPGRYSADLQSFFYPNAAQALGAWSHRYWTWPGNAAENGTYLGYGLMGLVLVGLLLRAPRVGAWLLVAVIGFVLALGPQLHWAGHPLTVAAMPYVYAEKGVPLLQFMGVPVRFAFAATFGLAAALAPSLDALARRAGWWVAGPLAALAIAEHAPHPFVTSSYPTPPPMLEWATDTSDFAVLDACRDSRHLWHQTVHLHPIFGGYLTRTPSRLEQQLANDPVAGPLWARDPVERTAPLTATALDFPFDSPIVEGAEPTQFSFDLSGELLVDTPVEATFTVESDDGAELLVDGVRIVDDRGSHPARQATGTMTLSAGAHLVTVRYQQFGGAALLRVWWSPNGEPRRILGAGDVPAGFMGEARYRRRELKLPRDDALAHLHHLKVRYVVQTSEDSRYPMESQLGLRPLYEGLGVRIYAVP